jgi:hypothetical protein
MSFHFYKKGKGYIYKRPEGDYTNALMYLSRRSDSLIALCHYNFMKNVQIVKMKPAVVPTDRSP